MWHILPALIGQFYDAPTRTLTFAPKFIEPFELPVLVPGTVATLTVPARASGSDVSDDSGTSFTFTVQTGIPLVLDHLSMWNVTCGKLPATLRPGESIQCSA